ncbi:MAG: hypothetical protein V4598_18475 [Bdellovibrionota bacterium]
MNDLIREVTPLTKGIVWLRPEELSPKDDHYQAIDYLLNGLLTATLKNNSTQTSLLMGQNFNRKIYVFATQKDVKKNELASFFSLLEKDLNSEDKILVVDDVEGREAFLKTVPAKLLSHFHVVS